MAARGNGHPGRARELAQEAVRQHNANHRGERRAPVTQGPPKVTHPPRPGSRPDDASVSMPEGGNVNDPARQARRRDG